MIFDVYFAFKNKAGVTCPGVKPNRMEWDQIMKMAATERIEEICKGILEHPENKAELKKSLPAVCFTANCFPTRAAANAIPTQLVMIDIDHLDDPRAAFEKIHNELGQDWLVDNVMVAHVTPSNKGLRLVFMYSKDFGANIVDQMKGRYEQIKKFVEGGDFDPATKDFCRLSFLPHASYFLFHNARLYMNTAQEQTDGELVNPAYQVKPEPSEAPAAQPAQPNGAAAQLSGEATKLEVETFSDSEKEEFESMQFRGTPVKLILEKYLEKYGTPKPGDGETHNYYNELVKYFRSLVSNNKRALLYLLPRFGHTEEECWSQIKSICKVNTLSTLPKEFYFFLKDNGFYKSREDAREMPNAMKEFMLGDAPKDDMPMPPLPPVFRELVRTAPKDFILPSINALLPILGTLTSYVGAEYPYDGRIHTTSFFSIIWAPPGTGKGFVERFIDLLFEDLKLRDALQQAREDVYLRFLNRRGGNDKAPDRPHTSLRLIPAKNSEAEFLEKQRDNHGYHMFTYAAEMDSWAKGVRAAGGNKDDMIRIAWDNGEYGQSFKSANTFKGVVRLYWNVLICGTRQQVDAYFKNVENGLVTRCSFFSIENQEFQEAQIWKKLSKRDKEVIKKFLARCDSNTYKEPCTLCENDWLGVNDDDFDKEIDWKFTFKDRQIVDMSWLMPVINAFHKEQIRKASLDIDKARDVFRRRVGVRGFRLGLLCTCLWDKMTEPNRDLVKKFVAWWMREDLESILQMWGAKYNDQAEVSPSLKQRSVFAELPEKFSRSDVYVVCMKQGIKTPIRNIIYNWKKMGYVEQVDKETLIKKKQ